MSSWLLAKSVTVQICAKLVCFCLQLVAFLFLRSVMLGPCLMSANMGNQSQMIFFSHSGKDVLLPGMLYIAMMLTTLANVVFVLVVKLLAPKLHDAFMCLPLPHRVDLILKLVAGRLNLFVPPFATTFVPTHKVRNHDDGDKMEMIIAETNVASCTWTILLYCFGLLSSVVIYIALLLNFYPRADQSLKL